MGLTSNNDFDLYFLYDLALEETIKGNPDQMDELIRKFKHSCSQKDRSELLSHVKNKYIHSDIPIKTTVLRTLYEIDENFAYGFAREELESTYLMFRYWGAHMHSLVTIIYDSEGLRVPTSSIEHDDNMKIAFELINNKIKNRKLNSVNS